MVLTGLHLLLTYRCTHACDHCFVYGSPKARGTFTRKRMHEALAQARDVGSIEWIYFEGGEPFLFYPMMLEGLRAARALGFRAGVVTNAYWAETQDDAEMWLRPLKDLGLADLSLSDDAFHGEEGEGGPVGRALEAARALGMPARVISIPRPPAGEGVRFRGRAADRLLEGVARQPASRLTRCPDEDLAAPGRVHLDAFGNVHLCQGLLLGKAWETPLVDLLARYDAPAHPIVGPLLRGGPAALAAEHGLDAGGGWADACHLCFEMRRRLRGRFPESLAPDGVYVDPEAR